VSWLISVGIITFFAALNIRSLRSMALSSVAFAVIILIPVAAMTALGLAAWGQSPLTPFVPPGQSVAASLGLGLTTAIWFYSGYESMSTMAGEVAEPQRVIPRALLVSLPMVVAIYLLPTLAGLASVGRWAEWDSETGLTLVDVARELGGPLLGGAMMVAALVSSLALYNAYLAAGARTTLVMAERRLLPSVLARVHPRFGTPHGSILVAAAIHALLALGSFEVLLVIDVFLFVMSYLLIFAAGIALRVKEPGLARPFRIPLGTGAFVLFAAVPMAVGLVVLVASGVEYSLAGAAAAATGPVAYVLLRRPAR
jgi:amino acid transporter